MNSPRAVVIAIVVLLSGQHASGQEMFSYRKYVLESTVKSVIEASGTRAADVKTVHERPATIQELQWRAPYVTSADKLADPVQAIAFAFYNDALYRVVVTYDRYRTEGLTNADLIELLSTTYGPPVLPSARNRLNPTTAESRDSLVLARWDKAGSSVSLVRGTYAPEIQLILLSTSLSLQAENATREAKRLDAIDAPRREADERKRQDADSQADKDKMRSANRAGFRP